MTTPRHDPLSGLISLCLVGIIFAAIFAACPCPSWAQGGQAEPPVPVWSGTFTPDKWRGSAKLFTGDQLTTGSISGVHSVTTVTADAEPVGNPYTLTILGRTSSATSLGYDGPSYGVALWHERAGSRLTLRTELTATTATKPATGDGFELAYSAIIEQRFTLGDGWWIGPGVEYVYDHAGGAERWTVGAGFSDETAEGVGQAFTLRILGEDSTPYQTHGALLRWQALRSHWTWAVEFSELAFTLPDGSRSWGRRYTALVGRRFAMGGAP
jgi:hypothetical protein